MKNILSEFPPPRKLLTESRNLSIPYLREYNSHIHTPYSFSAFPDIKTIIENAKSENISVLGINDIEVTDGYEEFHNGCISHSIFPLFGIEFTGILMNEQLKGIRINDRKKPGIIHISGKGLDFPFETGWIQKIQLKNLRKYGQNHVRAIIIKLNELIRKDNPSFYISYDLVKNEFARQFVSERHVAKALRVMAKRRFDNPEEQLSFIENLYGRKSQAGLYDPVTLEEEIRSNLFMTGGAAYIEENSEDMIDLRRILKIITASGGIPFYQLLLDDPSGELTEFETDPEKLSETLKKTGISCIEIFPGRNDISRLREYVNFFHDSGFVITFGTGHDRTGLTLMARNSVPLDENLKRTGWEGACIIAAHQYLRADGRQGYVLPDGSHSVNQMQELVMLGQHTIEFFLNRSYEPR